jgi:hypothetical protein
MKKNRGLKIVLIIVVITGISIAVVNILKNAKRTADETIKYLENIKFVVDNFVSVTPDKTLLLLPIGEVKVSNWQQDIYDMIYREFEADKWLNSTKQGIIDSHTNWMKKNAKFLTTLFLK